MIDTFDKLIELPDVKFRILVWMNPAKIIDSTAWSLAAGKTYTYKTVLLEVSISAVKENNSQMTLKSNTTEVEATAGSYWFDPANGLLYVHCLANANPNTKTITAFVWKKFSSEPCVFDGHQHLPFVKANSLPALQTSVDDIVDGIYKFNFGSFTMLNDGWWDKNSANYIWTNRRVIIKVGGEDLPLSEYKSVFVGRLSDYWIGDLTCSFTVKDVRVGTFSQLPLNHYWKSNYANLSDEDEGKPIAMIYGSVDGVIPVCIDPTAGVGGTWKLSDRKLHAVRVVHKNNGTLTITTDYTLNADKNEITLLCGFDALNGDVLAVDVDGFVDGSNALLVNGSLIALDILKTYLGFVDDELDLTAFASTAAIRTVELAVIVDTDQSSRDILQTIGRSILSFITPTNEGKLALTAYVSNIPSDVIRLYNEDYRSWSVGFDDNFVKDKVAVRYNYSPRNEVWQRVEKTNLAIYYAYEIRETLTIDTYLKLKDDADLYATGLLDLVSNPILTIKTTVGAKVFEQYPTKKILINRSRAADPTGSFIDKPFRIKSIEKDFGRQESQLILLDDLQSIGSAYCSSCYHCQSCFTQQSSCTVCYVCQACNTDQNSACGLCNVCQMCNSCQFEVSPCPSSCDICNSCVSCYSCQVCDSGQAICPTCQECNTCQGGCYYCQICNSAQACTSCYSCFTCQVCVSNH